MTRSCIGLVAALHIFLSSLIPTDTADNLIIIKIKRAVERFIWVMENGMTEFSLLRLILSSARNQPFKKKAKFKRVRWPAYNYHHWAGEGVVWGKEDQLRSQKLSFLVHRMLSRLRLLFSFVSCAFT